MHRFVVPPGAIAGEEARISGAIAHQIRNVLRLRIGDRVVLLDNRGWAYEVELTAVVAQELVGRVIERRASAAEPRLRVVLYQALLKADKIELVLQKGTEIGVHAFVPLVTERTMVQRPEDLSERKLERWRRIVVEAAEQSRRGVVPEVAAPQRLAAACAGAVRPAFLLWEGEQARRLRDVLTELKTDEVGTVGLFVGPEGGFSADEAEGVAAHGVLPVGLGPRILRAETAGLVAAALVLYGGGDLG